MMHNGLDKIDHRDVQLSSEIPTAILKNVTISLATKCIGNNSEKLLNGRVSFTANPVPELPNFHNG